MILTHNIVEGRRSQPIGKRAGGFCLEQPSLRRHDRLSDPNVEAPATATKLQIPTFVGLADQPVEIANAGNFLAIDLEYDIARLESVSRRRRIPLNRKYHDTARIGLDPKFGSKRRVQVGDPRP